MGDDVNLSFYYCDMVSQGYPGGSVVKNPPANAEEAGSIWLRKIL